MITRIHHIGVAVRSLDEALGLYRDILGLSVRSLTVQDSLGAKLAFLGIGGMEIELLEPLDERTPVGQLLAFLGLATPLGRLSQSLGETEVQLTFESDDCEGDLRAAGLQPLFRRDLPQGSATLLRAQEHRGAVVELCQPLRNQPALQGGSLIPGFQRVHHLLVLTADLDDAVRRWERTLARRAAERLQPEGSGLRTARIPVGDSALYLVEPFSGTGRLAWEMRQWGEGLCSLGLEVRELGEAVDYLRQNGVQASDPEVGAWPGTQVAYVSPASTHGLPLHLVQPVG